MNFYCFFLSLFLFTISVLNPRNGKQDCTRGNYNVLEYLHFTGIKWMHTGYGAAVTITECVYAWYIVREHGTLWLNITVEWHDAHTMPFFVSLFVIHWSGLSGAKLYSIRIVFINWQKAQYARRAWNAASDCARKSIVNNTAPDIENGVYVVGVWRSETVKLMHEPANG